MVRNYKKKEVGGRRNFSNCKEMEDAYNAVMKKQMSVTEASKHFGVNKKSLLRRTSGEIPVNAHVGRQIVKGSTAEIRKKWADGSSVVRKESVEMKQRSVVHQGTVAISRKFITPTERRLLAVLGTKAGPGGSSHQRRNNSALIKQEGAASSLDDSNMDESVGFWENEDSPHSENTTACLRQAEEGVAGAHSQKSVKLQLSAPNIQQRQIHNPGDDFLDESGTTPIQNGVNSAPLKHNRIVKYSDVLLALKRKKLRVLEEQVKIERERLDVEKGILQILKEIRNKHDRRSELL